MKSRFRARGQHEMQVVCMKSVSIYTYIYMRKSEPRLGWADSTQRDVERRLDIAQV
jgi:hypothetical protein